MKHLVFYLNIVFLLLTAACHREGDGSDTGRSYLVNGIIAADSTLELDHLMLYADNHVSLRSDTLILSAQQTFLYEGRTAGFDEIYLCSDGGELCRFFASGGMEVNLTIDKQEGAPTVVFSASPTDTVNAWMSENLKALDCKPVAEQHTVLDSLCHQHPADIRNTLLLREMAGTLNDSVFVRRCLGALADEAKPDWLIKDIDQILFETAPSFKVNRRLSSYKWQTNDSISFDMSSSRSEYLLIYCWADYNQASVDSLKALSKLIADEYDMKRLILFSCCLHAPDSIWWRNRIEAIEGKHVFVPAGLSDQRIRSWRVQQMPALILCDMYGNVQQRDVWGETLRESLNRVPNRSGFAHTPKKKPNGR